MGDPMRGPTWNPTTGCTKISSGCQSCYAEKAVRRLVGRYGYPTDDPFRVVLHPERLTKPLRWRKQRWVFVNKMGDLFHPDVPDEFLDKVFAVMALTPRITYLILTRRPNRMRTYLLEHAADGQLIWTTAQRFNSSKSRPQENTAWPLPNVWLGVAAEDQDIANERIPVLLQTPATVRFVAIEPMLGPVDLTRIQFNKRTVMNVLEGVGISKTSWAQTIPNAYCERLDWVIVGGEIGPNARPIHPDWVRSLRDQAQAAKVPFFFKGWGQWVDLSPGNWQHPPRKNRSSWADSYVLSHKNQIYVFPDGRKVVRVGHKSAGRLLDGRTWDEVPIKNLHASV